MVGTMPVMGTRIGSFLCFCQAAPTRGARLISSSKALTGQWRTVMDMVCLSILNVFFLLTIPQGGGGCLLANKTKGTSVQCAMQSVGRNKLRFSSGIAMRFMTNMETPIYRQRSALNLNRYRNLNFTDLGKVSNPQHDQKWIIILPCLAGKALLSTWDLNDT